MENKNFEKKKHEVTLSTKKLKLEHKTFLKITVSHGCIFIHLFVLVKAKMAEMVWHFHCCDNAASKNEWLFNVSSSRVPLNSSRGVLFPHLSSTHSCLFLPMFFNTVFKTFEIRIHSFVLFFAIYLFLQFAMLKNI